MTIALILACTAAAWFDVRERRIPNALTLGALAVAIIIRATAGIEVVGAGLLGALVGFSVALPFFLVGGLGGGDLKLIAAIGAFLGPGRLFFALLITALVGGVMAVTTIIRRKAGLETAANLHTLIASFGLRNFTGGRKDS
jgi:prepilin peptidase CpaA